MRARRIACLLLGFWLGACVLMAWITTDSFRAVDRLLVEPNPVASPLIHGLGSKARMLFRYQVSEQNRAAFATWEMVQLAFGAGLFLFLLFGSRERKLPMILVLVMLAVVAVQRLLFTPTLVNLGRSLDFAAADSGSRSAFWVAHSAYSGAEVFKWLVGLFLGLKLAGRSRSRDSRDDLDVVDKRNHRHVNW
jgi:hypothetical protein